MSAKRLKAEYLSAATDSLNIARDAAGELIGHCTFRRFWYKNGSGFCTLITQLVVQADVRGRGIANDLCMRACTSE